jgi:RNA polymerase sigma factor (sigma-70 family)
VRDDELVTAALAGEPAAFAALAERNRARVEAVVERMVGDEAEDVVQEALLRAYLGLSQLRDPARFAGWLCGIAVNLAKMRLRRRALERKRSLALTLDQPRARPTPTLDLPQGGLTPRRLPRQLAAEPAPDGSFEELELLRVVREALDVLPPGQREVVLMHYLDGLSCEEIAAALGSSSGAVRVRLHRARERLRGELAALAPAPTPKEEIRMIEMRLEDVIVRVAEDDPMKVVADQRVVLLKHADNERVLPIWIGSAEGNSLALRLTGESAPRPVTSDVMAELLRVTGARVERVVVTSLRKKTFYAVIAVAVDGRVDELDARPSDALNLAVRVGAPILADEAVLEQCAMPPGDIAARLDAEADTADLELPRGEWRSLSAELLRSLYRWG